jgi:hypothetical protein
MGLGMQASPLQLSFNTPRINEFTSLNSLYSHNNIPLPPNAPMALRVSMLQQQQNAQQPNMQQGIPQISTQSQQLLQQQQMIQQQMLQQQQQQQVAQQQQQAMQQRLQLQQLQRLQQQQLPSATINSTISASGQLGNAMAPPPYQTPAGAHPSYTTPVATTTAQPYTTTASAIPQTAPAAATLAPAADV